MPTRSVVGIVYYSMIQNCFTVNIELNYSECVLLPLNPEQFAGLEVVTHTPYVDSSSENQPAAAETAPPCVSEGSTKQPTPFADALGL